MKKYAIILFSALFMLALTTNAQAQTAQKKEKGPSLKERVEKMAKELSLNDAEKAKLTTLLEKQSADKKKFNAEHSKESADYKEKSKEFKKGQEAELKLLLGEEKYKTLQEIKEEEKKSKKKSE
jgi:Spy/CpxP family protein refolding chaperone